MAAQDKKEQERNQAGTTNERQDPENREERNNAEEGRLNSDVDHKSRGHKDADTNSPDRDNGTQGRNASDSR